MVPLCPFAAKAASEVLVDFLHSPRHLIEDATTPRGTVQIGLLQAKKRVGERDRHQHARVEQRTEPGQDRALPLAPARCLQRLAVVNRRLVQPRVHGPASEGVQGLTPLGPLAFLIGDDIRQPDAPVPTHTGTLKLDLTKQGNLGVGVAEVDPGVRLTASAGRHRGVTLNRTGR